MKHAIWLTDCQFEGERHDRLKRIWRALAEYWRERAAIYVLKKPAPSVWTHADCLRMQFAKASKGVFQHVIFTEFDFLPSFDGFFQSANGKAIKAVRYILGVGGEKPHKIEDFSAPWYVVFDMKRLEVAPDFCESGPYNDPGCALDADLMDVEFAYPEHCGARCAAGDHLFWQRHLHDPPEDDHVVGVEHMPLGEMRLKHDLYVTKWLSSSPLEFQELYLEMVSEEARDAAKT